MKTKEMQKYINGIRNKAKKDYAKKYYLFLTENRTEGTIEPKYINLSYMGAQAVRMNLNKLYFEF